MSDESFTYICETCKKSSRIKDGEPIPQCCGALMKRYETSKPSLKDEKKENG